MIFQQKYFHSPGAVLETHNAHLDQLRILSPIGVGVPRVELIEGSPRDVNSNR